MALCCKGQCGVVEMGNLLGMLHSDCVVMIPRRDSLTLINSITSSPLLGFLFCSHSFGLEFSGPPIYYQPCSEIHKDARHVVVFDAPFTISCTAICSGQRPAVGNRYLWTYWAMSTPPDYQCYCTAGLLQLLLSVRLANHQHLRQW